jgi:mRNA interferase MazF
MRRGEIYRVTKPSSLDPKKYRYFVIVSRQVLIETNYSTVICAPIYSAYHGLHSQVPVGSDENLPHASSIHCDGLISLPKSMLTHFIGLLSQPKLNELNQALKVALAIID